MAQEWSYLERFFRDSFLEGQTHRELRLSSAEQQYLQEKYPRVAWRPQGSSFGGKAWYQVILPAAAEFASQ